MSRNRTLAYRLMTAVGPLMVPVGLLIGHSHLRLGQLTADTLAGFVAGAGVGLSIVGLVKLQRASRTP